MMMGDMIIPSTTIISPDLALRATNSLENSFFCDGIVYFALSPTDGTENYYRSPLGSASYPYPT